MYTIDRLIEKTQNKLDQLERLNEVIEDEMSTQAELIADEMRERVSESIEEIITQNIDFELEAEIFEGDIEDEMREEFVDQVRMNF